MNTSTATFEEVLRFWFGTYPLEPAAMQRAQAQWFSKSAAFDAEVRTLFGHTIEAAQQGALDGWADQPDGRLALLIVLDQFTRNAYRNQAQSFAADAQALQLALDGVRLRHDQAVPPMARIFCYLPIEHAEDGALQARSVGLFEALAAAPVAQPPEFFANTLDFARRHREVIERFGRFPHRNAILGRTSTPEELAYLSQPGAGF